MVNMCGFENVHKNMRILGLICIIFVLIISVLAFITIAISVRPLLYVEDAIIQLSNLKLENDDLSNMLILPQNKMAVLMDEIYYSEFDAELRRNPEIQTIFIVTDSETAYRSMIRSYDDKDCYQLYRDYLDNFRINTGR